MVKTNDNISALLGELGKMGVCRSGRRYLNMTDRDFGTLVKVWRGWPEYLAEHAPAALPLLRAHLTSSDRERLAGEYLFVDYKGVVPLDKTTYPVFVLGDSDLRLVLPEFAVVKLYAFNAASVEVDMADKAILNAEAYNESGVSVREGWRGKTTCYVYDDAGAYGVERVHRGHYLRGEVFNGKEFRRPAQPKIR